MNRVGLYLVANFGFVLIVAAAKLLNSESDVHPLYLVLLFAVCSTPILHLQRLNDRYALLAIFLGVYFLFYGVLDLERLLRGMSNLAGPGLLSKAESLILIGGAVALAGYHVVCRGGDRGEVVSDWPERTLVIAGCVLWVVCTWLSWEFKVNVMLDTSSEAQQRGLAGLTKVHTSILLIGMLLQPLSILMLVYAQLKYKRAYLTPVVVTVVLVQLIFGFIIDVKGEALLGAALVIVARLLVIGKVPIGWLGVLAAFIVVAFPVMQANRIVRGDYGIDRSQAARALGEVFERARDLSKQVTAGPNRANTFFERMSAKGSVEMIVSRTGREVRFQHGHTLSPMITAFIPRLIWPTKPDVQVGRLMNKEFQVSSVADTYISPSHLGELYWNFGSTGVFVGMFAIGLLMGFVGSRFNLADAATLTRLMVLVATVQLLVLGFEGPIAPRYVVWMRSMIGVGLLHLLFARAVIHAGGKDVSRDESWSRPRALFNVMR